MVQLLSNNLFCLIFNAFNEVTKSSDDDQITLTHMIEIYFEPCGV